MDVHVYVHELVMSLIYRPIVAPMLTANRENSFYANFWCGVSESVSIVVYALSFMGRNFHEFHEFWMESFMKIKPQLQHLVGTSRRNLVNFVKIEIFLMTTL